MSENEEPPPKVLKVENSEESAAYPDTTNMSELGEDSNMTDSTDPNLDDTAHTQDTSNFIDASNLPDRTVEGITTSNTTDPKSMTGQTTAETDSTPDTGPTPDVKKDTVMDTVDTVEDQLQESFEETGSQGGSQEEWLSEGILTDDDFNPAAQEQSDSQTSQPNANEDATPLPAPTTPEPAKAEAEQATVALTAQEIVAESQQNIEDALNTLEGGPVKGFDLPEDLDAFLIKKSDIKSESQVKSENIKEEDDGNDTDDLLRMLGEDDNKSKKKLTKTVKDIRNGVKAELASSDEDDFVYEGASIKKVHMAKSLSSKQQLRAKRNTDDGDAISDDACTLKRMFAKNISPNHSKSTLRSVRPPSYAKNIINVVQKPKKEHIATSTPLRPRSLLKPAAAPPLGTALTRLKRAVPAPAEPVEVKRELKTYSRVNKPTAVRKPPQTLTNFNVQKTALKPKEEVKHEDLDDQNIHLDENELDTLDTDFEDSRQRIMRPERMDEEVASDDESHSEDGSLYDELPSSDSEDIDDWFQLDIRAEKAGDYLPLLGTKAKQLLLEEKSRVSARLANLKQSLCALTDSGKQQAEQVRAATMTLAELDDMLKAS